MTEKAQIYITERTLEHYKDLCCRSEKVAVQFLRWLIPLCVCLVLWIALFAIALFTYAKAQGITYWWSLFAGCVGATMACLIAFWTVYSIRQKTRKTLRLIETIRERTGISKGEGSETRQA